MSIVTFASVDFDSDGFFDDGNDQFLVPDDLDGYYSLYAKVDWEDGTGAVRTRIEFNNDFANINNAESWAESTSGSDTTGYVHIVRYMNAGDLIHLKVAHNQGTDRSVIGTGDAHGSYFGIAFLGM
jgi:hypothetical protein